MNEIIQSRRIQLQPLKRRMAVIYDIPTMLAIDGGIRHIRPGSGGLGKIIDKSPIKACKDNMQEQSD